MDEHIDKTWVVWLGVAILICSGASAQEHGWIVQAWGHGF